MSECVIRVPIKPHESKEAVCLKHERIHAWCAAEKWKRQAEIYRLETIRWSDAEKRDKSAHEKERDDLAAKLEATKNALSWGVDQLAASEKREAGLLAVIAEKDEAMSDFDHEISCTSAGYGDAGSNYHNWEECDVCLKNKKALALKPTTTEALERREANVRAEVWRQAIHLSCEKCTYKETPKYRSALDFNGATYYHGDEECSSAML